MKSKDDPTIQRIRDARMQISEQFKHNAGKYIDYLMSEQKKHKINF